MVEHTPPKMFPPFHYAGIAVPSDFARVISAAAAKDGVLFEDQLLKWAQMGAEHSRLCGPKTTKSGRTNR